VLRWVRKYHADAELLAALYYGAHLTHTERWEDLRFALRDFWRAMLCYPSFDVTAEVLEEAWRIVARLIPYEPPHPTAIVDELTRLAQFETRDSFLRALEARYHYPGGTCAFDSAKVRRASLDEPVGVTCLVIRDDAALPNRDEAIGILQEWMRFEDLDYYRIACPDCNRVRRMLFYEVLDREGIYWAKDRGDAPLELGPITPRPANWDVPLLQIQTRAARVDAGLILPRAKAALDRAKMGPI